MVAVKTIPTHCQACGGAYALIGRVHRCAPGIQRLRQIVIADIPPLAAEGNEALAAEVARGIDKMMSEAICGVDIARPGGDMSAYATLTKCEDGKITVTSVAAEEPYRKPPKRNRAAYMRDYRARKRAENAQPEGAQP